MRSSEPAFKRLIILVKKNAMDAAPWALAIRLAWGRLTSQYLLLVTVPRSSSGITATASQKNPIINAYKRFDREQRNNVL